MDCLVYLLEKDKFVKCSPFMTPLKWYLRGFELFKKGWFSKTIFDKNTMSRHAVTAL